MAMVAGAPPALDFRAAFQKELNDYMKTLEKPSSTSGAKKDPKKLEQMRRFAEEFQDGICRRFATYISESVENEVTFQPGVGGIDASSRSFAEDVSQSAKRARVEELRAELRRKVAEEDRLRSEYKEKMKVHSDECLRSGDMELDNARKEALASVSRAEESYVPEKADLLKLSLEQLQAQMSETESVVETLEKDAAMLKAIEEQRSRPQLGVEELFRSTSNNDLAFGDERTNADITRNQEVNERWKKEFEKDVL